ncbi:hypothetical protein [Christiangramia sp. LLG6405-1]|uniref:hypothetical protein n=1 Tax=Christiangramia sp. LLG6405-1 TaxID=3160832 RepID=UPI0038663DDA
MKEENSDEDFEKKRLSDLKNELIIHYHQDATFYERRTYIIFFVISGVGLYTCLELYKSLENVSFLLPLSICTSLFIIPLIMSIISNELARKKSIYKADYFQTMEETYRKGTRKYIKWENGLKITIGFIYLIGSIFIGTLYYLNF